MIVIIALILLGLFLILYTTREYFSAVDDPEQYVNSLLTANF
jgi:hypothetical protein